MEIAGDNLERVYTRDEQNEDHKSEKSEDIVESLQPHGRHDEEELYEDGTERKNATDEHRGRRTHVPSLRRYLPCNFICAHWGL